MLRRYAGDAPSHVVLLEELEGAAARLGRPRTACGPVTRATVVWPQPLVREEAAAWVRAAGDGAVAAALEALNRVLAAHRVAAGDPDVPDVAAHRALRLRAGAAADPAAGRGPRARERELPVPPAPPPAGCAGREAALLEARDVALAAEELALRARGDLARGREREAALQARAALEAGLAELEAWREEPGMQPRREHLRAREAAARAAADAALLGAPAAHDREAVVRALDALEEALLARARAVRW